MFLHHYISPSAINDEWNKVIKVISTILKVEIDRWHQHFFVLHQESNISEVVLLLGNIFKSLPKRN